MTPLWGPDPQVEGSLSGQMSLIWTKEYEIYHLQSVVHTEAAETYGEINICVYLMTGHIREGQEYAGCHLHSAEHLENFTN